MFFWSEFVINICINIFFIELIILDGKYVCSIIEEMIANGKIQLEEEELLSLQYDYTEEIVSDLVEAEEHMPLVLEKDVK